MTEVEVFADISCPFTHVGLHRLTAERTRRSRPDLRFLVRAWPLELINGAPLQGSTIAPKIDVLRQTVAPDLFAGFDPTTFPTTSLPALALVEAAYQRSIEAGERLSLALRAALFEGGADIADPDTLAAILQACAVDGLEGDEAAVITDWKEGEQRGVEGSPHFFLPQGDWFCPSLEISHVDGELRVAFDDRGFAAFTEALFA